MSNGRAIERRAFIRRAAALGLGVTGAGWQRLLAAPIPAAKLRGHVVAEDHPVEGVRVSDGYRVVATNDSGEFSIRVGPESGPFLFVTVPPGYWADRFYVPTAQAVVNPPLIRLKRTPRRADYTAIFLTDIHLGEGHAERSFSRFQATIDEINALDPLPAFCWVGGDITLQGGQGERYAEMMSRLRMPVRNAVGNHEMVVRQHDPREPFQRLFGPTYYSFEVGDVHYVTLDGCRVNPQAEGYKNVEGLLSSRELHWLAEDLRHVPEGLAKVVAVHIPLVSSYAERRDTTAAKVPYWIVQNADEVIDILAAHGVALVLQGHLHENERIMQKGIEFVESISVCGRWWKAAETARENGVSGEPRGYRILDIHGSNVRHRYQSSAEARTDEIGEIAGRPSRLMAGNDATVSVNIFDASSQAVVSGSIDDHRFERLEQGAVSGYHEDLQPAHHWKWKISAAELTPGVHVLRVRVDEPERAVATFTHEVSI